MPDLILAADIGGTKADVGLFTVESGRPVPLRTATLPTSSYGSPSGLLDTFLLMDALSVKAACVAVAGQVREGATLAPNLPWQVSLQQLKKSLEIDAVELVNDLVATALGIPEIPAGKTVALQTGNPEEGGTRALIAPGTGLGQSIMVAELGGYRPIPSEGGHSDFAPADELQCELLSYARVKLGGHVSVERMLCGQGLKLIYDFLIDAGYCSETTLVCDLFGSVDHAAVVTGEALAERDDACSRTLELYLSILGAEAGNLALKSLCTGGLYLGGGIAPKIAGKLASGPFLEGFRAKGRMTGLMERIPVTLIAEPRTALLGAAARAAGIYGDER